MKRKSKLFLAVAGIMTALGVLICLAGYFVSLRSGERILAGSLDNGKGYTEFFGAAELDKIKLSVDDADINIIGGSDRPYMEILNFNESLYSFTSNSAMITFNQSPDFSSVSGLWESGFSFKGLRYFLFPGTGKGDKVINVYLDSVEKVKSFDLFSESGNITLSGVSADSEFNIRIGSGSVSISELSADCTLNIQSETTASPVKISMDNTEVSVLRISAPKAEIKASALRARFCDIEVTGGSADIDYTPIGDTGCSVEIATSSKLTVNGDAYEVSSQSPYKYGEEAPDKDKLAAAEGSGDGNGENTVKKSYLKIKADDLSVDLELHPTEPDPFAGEDDAENNS